jgi:hypothetical protein
VLEIAMVGLGVALLALLALGVALSPPLVLLWVSLGAMLLGSLLGVPFGLRYHLLLRRELLRLGKLPARWYWHPTRLHEQLDAPGHARVRLAFLLGAWGFGLIMLGCGLATVTLFTHFS